MRRESSASRRTVHRAHGMSESDKPLGDALRGQIDCVSGNALSGDVEPNYVLAGWHSTECGVVGNEK